MPTFHWQRPIEVPMSLEPDYPARLKDEAGIYMFSRQWGDGAYQPFYIGQALKLSRRLGQYMKSKGDHELRVRNVIIGGKDAKSGFQRQNGSVYFHFGYLVRIKRLPVGTTLDKAERALIQFALITGETLINHQLAGKAALNTFEMTGTLYGGLLKRQIVAHR